LKIHKNLRISQSSIKRTHLEQVCDVLYQTQDERCNLAASWAAGERKRSGFQPTTSGFVCLRPGSWTQRGTRSSRVAPPAARLRHAPTAMRDVSPAAADKTNAITLLLHHQKSKWTMLCVS